MRPRKHPKFQFLIDLQFVARTYSTQVEHEYLTYQVHYHLKSVKTEPSFLCRLADKIVSVIHYR